MIYTTLTGRMRWSWIKNGPDLRAILTRAYPDFVYTDGAEVNTVPVFTFHSVEPESFELYCRSLVEGNYRTLGAEEFLEVAEGRLSPSSRSVVLTFDDGTASLWTVAFPLLRRYGLSGIAFVIPKLIPEAATGPTLDDVWQGRESINTIVDRERGPNPLCSWSEIETVHSTGVVSIQSHTHLHALLPVSSRIVDFLNPSTDPNFFGNVNIPLVSQGDFDQIERPLVLGRPVYESLPRMAGRTRYFDDERLRRHCEGYVEARGGTAFFKNSGWRRELMGVVRQFRNTHGEAGRQESTEAYRKSIIRELSKSRMAIEGRLSASVQHLCYPWFMGSQIAVDASKKVGYRTNFWGVPAKPNQSGRSFSPYHISRMDCRYIRRLPGPGRLSIRQFFSSYFFAGMHRSKGAAVGASIQAESR